MPLLPDHTLPDGLQWRLLSVDDLQPIMGLRARVLASLPLADLYVREHDELDFVARHLGQEGETLGVFDGDRLAAYAMLGLPTAASPDKLTHLLFASHPGLAACALDCATIASCMVHPDYRGQGLQRRLLQARFARALDHQRSLSRRHAKIVNEGGILFLREEVGTTNGTFINGERVPTGQARPLSLGDTLRFGSVELKVESL